MFDPTAFENMKVVLEGAIYDLDLNGEIVIIDRNDLINTAKLSRKYELKFKIDHFSSVVASIEMEAGLENLAAELLPGSLSQRKSGCSIRLFFSFKHQHKIVDFEKMNKVLTDIWGTKRNITQTVSFYPLQQDNMNSLITIEFGRLVQEDQIDDITAMIDFMLSTCEQLQNTIPRKK